MQIKLLDVVVDNGKTRVTDTREVEVATVDHDGNIEEKKVRLCDLELMQTDDMEFYVVDENNIRVEFKNLSDIALLKLSMDYEDMLRAVTDLYEVAEECVKEVTEDDANIAIVDLISMMKWMMKRWSQRYIIEYSSMDIMYQSY